jgi:MFS family permease
LVNFFTAPVFVLIPLIVKFKFNISLAGWVASYETSLALGAGIMAILLSFFHGFKKVYLVISFSLFIFGSGYILTGITSIPFIICIWLFLSGSSLAMINTHAIGLFQKIVPDSMKGRFFALLTTVCFATIPLAYIVTGYVSKYVAPDLLFLINGIMICVMGGVLYNFSLHYSSDNSFDLL